MGEHDYAYASHAVRTTSRCWLQTRLKTMKSNEDACNVVIFVGVVISIIKSICLTILIFVVKRIAIITDMITSLSLSSPSSSDHHQRQCHLHSHWRLRHLRRPWCRCYHYIAKIMIITIIIQTFLFCISPSFLLSLYIYLCQFMLLIFNS